MVFKRTDIVVRLSFQRRQHIALGGTCIRWIYLLTMDHQILLRILVQRMILKVRMLGRGRLVMVLLVNLVKRLQICSSIYVLSLNLFKILFFGAALKLRR